mmetsp:Transcript_12746/g.21979  ORF Transcript_12746/g.21979 Transcript_12746/m.21979 type:complete len:230 (+) Transcript_12746:941-1630(+)
MSVPSHPACTNSATRRRRHLRCRGASLVRSVERHHHHHSDVASATLVGRKKWLRHQEMAAQANGRLRPTLPVHQEPSAHVANPYSQRTIQRSALASDHLWVASEDPSVACEAAEEHTGAPCLDHPGRGVAGFAATGSTLSSQWMKLAQKVLGRQEHPVAAKADHKDVPAVLGQAMLQCAAGLLPLFAKASRGWHGVGLGAWHPLSPLDWTQVIACEIAVLAAIQGETHQ